MTREAVTETIRICKDRNVLREYLLDKEKEVVSIMMSLFDEEQIMKMHIKGKQREAAEKAAKKVARETAKRMLKMEKFSFEVIAECVPSLSFEELRELEMKVKQSI